MCRARVLEAAEHVDRAHKHRRPVAAVPVAAVAPACDKDGGGETEGERKRSRETEREREGEREAGIGEEEIRRAGGATEAAAAGSGGAGRAGEGGGERTVEGSAAVRSREERHEERSYWRLKRANGAYCARRETLLSTPTFRAWLVGGRDKQKFAVAEGGVVPLVAQQASLRSLPAGPFAEPRGASARRNDNSVIGSI